MLRTKLLKLFFLVVTIISITPIRVCGAEFDTVLKALFYNQNDSSYLILHESFYTPTSSSYEQGNVRSQGYTTSRISVYNLANRKLVARKEMGIMDSIETCYVLGCSPNNLWIYSNKFKSGLQSLFPLTLEKNISQANIYKSLNIEIGRFYIPKWQHINKYFGFDEIQHKLIVTNTNQQQYYIDAETFASQPIKEKIKLNPVFNKYTATSAVFNDSTWKLTGYEQMKFTCGNFTAQLPSFLNGQFILEQNTLRLFKHFYGIHANLISLKNESNTVNPLSESAIIDILIKSAKDNIDNLINGNKPDEVLMQTDSRSFYLLSKNEDTADARIKISKVRSDQFGEFTEEWSTSPAGMFYNIAQSRNTRAFKQFFGTLQPEFNYSFYQIHDNKLVLIYLLQVCCIDIETGKILWQFRLQ